MIDKITIPNKLKKGDTIGIIAPSAGNANYFPHRVENAIKFLNGMGFKTKLSKHAMNNVGYTSSSALDRANDIHEMFLDTSVKAVICTIGGNHSNQLLKYLDFNLIKNNPKIFLGYSDISVLLYAFVKRSSLQTYYGPCIMTQFGEFPEPLEYTLDYFTRALMLDSEIGEVKASDVYTSEILNWVTKSDLERPRKLMNSDGYNWLKQGKAAGQIIGGCVPSINHLIGTEYWVNPEGCVFFIDIPEGHEFGQGLPVSDLDSYFADLDNVNVFSSIKGLIIGRPYNYTNEQNEELKKILMYYTEKYNYPILLNVNIGHADPIITLPLLAEVVLDSEKNTFVVNN